ncbi:uncharacterized protein LOC109847171 isoform X2 [Asparagus officinalis]|uniref:uncharacterized protein LOC109847171 isoform X2 n=1 Tax=Asparagus officinalis TaxID=4686 RepID=UPI00098E1302|nr:uncharacterized protein LOC109847171 isoform X2 [Asparagus officinalis]
MASDHFDFFEIYARFCDIASRSDHTSSKDLLNMLSRSLESRGNMRDAIFDDLSKLMSCLRLSVDSRQFNCFYDFVFFVCRENGQKNITVSKAISAWRLVLTGRFRLLNQWCNFVEKHQKHNISEDTWQQLLAFSRSVNEDLEGYDPKGAWPILIDDFVEHMYRINQSSNCSAQEFCCSCTDMETPGITNILSGLNLLPGSKRKLTMETEGKCDATPMFCENYSNLDHKYKRAKQMDSDMCTVDGTINSQSDVSGHNLLGSLQTSPSACAVEGCLSKGFQGRLSLAYLRSRENYVISYRNPIEPEQEQS